jgi:glycosyltransferase involved in cell wall biosynthesis
MAAETAIVSDVWYGEHVGATLVAGPLWRRSFDLWRAGRQHELIVTQLGRAILPLIFVEAVRGRRRLILTQLQRPRPSRLHRRLLLNLVHSVLRPMLRRTVSAAQVLSSWECDAYASRLGIPRERIRFIPAPLKPLEPGPIEREGYVISSGRAVCDWETLFQAAARADWPLVVVCGKEDAARVRKLNRASRARVYVEISPEEHQRLVAAASVYVAALHEAAVSSGQMRVMEAHRVLTPVVATNVRGLADYLVPDVSALVVEPQDPEGLRKAVDKILADPALADALVKKAVERFASRSMEGYISEIQELVAFGHEAACHQRHGVSVIE